MKYYYAVNGQQMGPVEENQLAALGIRPETLVWHEGMPNWQPAGQLPELSELFSNVQPPTQPPVYQQPYYATTQGYQQTRANLGPKPQNYLVWAILVTILCCLPFGIVSIVYASKVDGLYNSGDYIGAQNASNSAKKWAIWSAVLGLVSSVVLTILYAAILGASGAAGLLGSY